jgi:hypothetical protein
LEALSTGGRIGFENVTSRDAETRLVTGTLSMNERR